MLLLLLACGSKEIFSSSDENGHASVVYGVANIDDDDGNGVSDWDDSEDALLAEENDVASFEIPQSYFDALGVRESLHIVQNSDGFRIYLDGERKTRSAGDDFMLEEGDTVIELGFQELNTSGTFSLERRRGQEKVVESIDIQAISAPLVINHHLQPYEQVYAMSGTGFVSNQQFITGFENALGDSFTSYSVREYEWDVWLQDEVEFANLYSPESRIDLVIDSIRDRGLDPLPENEWEAPDMPIYTWGSGFANSQDSFGNLEASPPVTVNGVEYPYGRIYYGIANYPFWGEETITEALTDTLEQQVVQSPFTLDISWLCVGHVDEFMTFIPDASSEKGFKIMITDVNVGYSFLEALDPEMSIPKYRAHGYDTVGEILADNHLRGLNEDIQLDYLEPAWTVLQNELGLTEDDLIRVPMLFEEAAECGGATATLIPSTVNMVVATGEDGQSADLVMPDPYFRSDVNSQSGDVFIEAVNALLPDGNTPHWIDDWREYHMMLGEVHCGSNTLRTPVENSWTLGRHLQEAE